jgi:hypothetical protein
LAPDPESSLPPLVVSPLLALLDPVVSEPDEPHAASAAATNPAKTKAIAVLLAA